MDGTPPSSPTQCLASATFARSPSSAALHSASVTCCAAQMGGEISSQVCVSGGTACDGLHMNRGDERRTLAIATRRYPVAKRRRRRRRGRGAGRASNFNITVSPIWT